MAVRPPAFPRRRDVLAQGEHLIDGESCKNAAAAGRFFRDQIIHAP